jgi:hypothetical protein
MKAAGAPISEVDLPGLERVVSPANPLAGSTVDVECVEVMAEGYPFHEFRWGTTPTKTFDVEFSLLLSGKIRVEAEDERAAGIKVGQMTFADMQAMQIPLVDEDMEALKVDEFTETADEYLRRRSREPR